VIINECCFKYGNLELFATQPQWSDIRKVKNYSWGFSLQNRMDGGTIHCSKTNSYHQTPFFFFFFLLDPIFPGILCPFYSYYCCSVSRAKGKQAAKWIEGHKVGAMDQICPFRMN
jgi:hypothetical protein